MITAVQKVEHGLPVPIVTSEVWDTIMKIAPACHQSRLFGVASPEAAAMIMLKGWELGLSLTTAFEFVQVVQGKPGLSPRGALAIVLKSGELAEWEIIEGDDFCEVYMKRRTGFSYRLRWTLAQAQKSGVIKPGSGWENYPANMLRWRAIGFVIDVVMPDVINGMKRTDELGADLTPAGDTVINGEFKVMPPKPVADSVPGGEVVTLQKLLETYTAEQIVTANEGKIPQTEADLVAVAEKLAKVQP